MAAAGALMMLGGIIMAQSRDLVARDPAGAPVVEMKTSMGRILIELENNKAPVTVANFLKYVEGRHYDGTVFHRVVGGHMIQGGGFEKQGDRLVEKPTDPPIASEAGNGVRNLKGTIAMARSDVPDSATAQFFINVQDNAMLDQSPAAPGYAVFGRVVEGMDVVEQINQVQTGVREVMGRLANGQFSPLKLKAVPLSDVVIESVRVHAATQSGSTSDPPANPPSDPPAEDEDPR